MKPEAPVGPGGDVVPGGERAPYTVESVESDQLVRLHFFVPRAAVSTTRFILEGYDHLGVQTSAPGSSRVTWTVPAALRPDAEALLADLLTRLR
jgi:hypothetical protein